MRKPRCAEPVEVRSRDDGQLQGYAACRKETPCADHPDGKIDTIVGAVAAQAKWKRDERTKQRRAR